jgi:mevalonate kinase
MVIGEHSVVYGHNAIATAINKRLYIEWETRNDRKIIINSVIAQYESELDNLKDNTKLTWIITTLKYFKNQLKQGFNIRVTSEFNSTLGLGSSAAVLAAMLGGLQFYLQQNKSIIENFKIGLQIIQQIQQRGSGTDLAASLAGGMILFNPVSQQIHKIKQNFKLPLNLIYTGYKTPTAKVLTLVHDSWLNQPVLLTSIYKLMGSTTKQAFKCLEKNDLAQFYLLVNGYQGLMDALGVNDLMLSKIIYTTRDMPQIKASKISGSGLGDCVLTFGKLNNHSKFINQLQPMAIQTSKNGLICEQA